MWLDCVARKFTCSLSTGTDLFCMLPLARACSRLHFKAIRTGGFLPSKCICSRGAGSLLYTSMLPWRKFVQRYGRHFRHLQNNDHKRFLLNHLADFRDHCRVTSIRMPGESHLSVWFCLYVYDRVCLCIIYTCSTQAFRPWIYIYTRNAWVLPRRCSVEVSHSQTNDVANYRNSYGENNKGTRDY